MELKSRVFDPLDEGWRQVDLNNLGDPNEVISFETAAHFLENAESLAEIGCFEWDIQANHVRWSDGLYRIYGLEPQEFKATLEGFLERVVVEDRDKVQSAVQTALETGGTFQSVERITHSSGEIRFLQSRGKVISDANGQPQRLIGVCQDVTETKDLENQLRQSQKMEAVGRLAAGIAHDFNNFLTVINLNAELLQLQPNSSKVQTFANAIQDAATRASNLTSQLLMFGRKATFNEKVVNLNHQLLEAKELLGSLLGDRISFIVELGENLPHIQVDPSHLDQVLVNLTVNATAALQKGGTFKIQTSSAHLSKDNTEGLPSGDYVTLEISDSGIGMDEAEVEHAFEPFFTNRDDGIGLGLFVVYGVVRDCGGSIQLTSQPGQGSQFRILFPAAASLPTSSSPSEVAQPTSARILLVEDEAPVRRATSAALRSNGYEVIEAGDSGKALEQLQSSEEQFDLLMTDVVMPGLTGIELAEKVKVAFPNVRILFTSGYSEPSKDLRPLLAKPFSIAELLDKIQTCMRNP